MTAYRLDHLAVAVPFWEGTGRYLTQQWGARWKHGFTGVPQFHPAQLSLRGARRVELLEPDGTPDSFVHRFLAGSGMRPRAHHVTFYVTDLEVTLARLREVGLTPQQVRVDNDLWREAFIYPKDSGLGFLAQVVQVSGDPALGPDGQASPYLCPRPDWARGDESEGTSGGDPASFECIVGVVADVDGAERLLAEVLGAAVTSVAGTQVDTRVYQWPEGPRLILEHRVEERPGLTAVILSQGAGPVEIDPALCASTHSAPHTEELGLRVAAV